MKKTALLLLSLGLTACQKQGPLADFFDPSRGGNSSPFGNSEFAQHAWFFLSQPGIWISLVFYASALFLWGYCINKVFFKNSRKKRHIIGFVFYLCFFPIWIFWMIDRYHMFVSGGY